jgi:hypothetical protein
MCVSIYIYSVNLILIITWVNDNQWKETTQENEAYV